MSNLTPMMRLKVKRDTFFLPDSNSGVYFRNNKSSFRMEGDGIGQWIEKLLPMFNGKFTLGDLTDGLPVPYRNRVYEIAEVLYRNEYVRDVSQDLPHELSNQVLTKYASQIEFLDSFGDSSAYRFQTYRQAKVLAVGAGPFFVSLVSSLLESGLPKFQMLITDSVPTNRQRLMELVEHARNTDAEIAVEEVSLQKDWREIIKPFDSILYVSQEGDIEEIRALQKICKEEKKVFLPALCHEDVGLAGPLVHPDSNTCWDSAWRRMHRAALSKEQQFTAFSTTAGAMLANVITFELFKEITEVTEAEQRNLFYLLDLDTLEGNWHLFLPHPLVDGHLSTEWVTDLDVRLNRSLNENETNNQLLLYFSQLTSEVSGIFHKWEEEDLKQLPLSQCRVQAVDLLSEGPAELLPDIVCAGLTHEEARRNAGLAGIESYVSQAVERLVATLPSYKETRKNEVEIKEFIGVGAGETVAEGICRGLQKCLDRELSFQLTNKKIQVAPLQVDTVEDERCRFYLEALTTIHGSPTIGLGEEVNGFPVIWVGTNDRWYGGVDLNSTLALRKALQQALMNSAQALEVSSVLLEEKVPLRLAISAYDEKRHSEILHSAIQILEQNHKWLSVIDLAFEPFLKEGLAGVFGVLLGEEGGFR
ncbi:putative thiazole-containing bacteriocin maturation protein [Sporosarcina sp. ACRSL]|uniref:putative thiazole-containing bacteriocin maturation protein n=1 Tax=Sporosarcina sp. ACRSL TaxID=2918215 RepID=UPI001EF4CC94|nr:putative thiazole-containing bacteriocin maturation protein [Sporosarcina sp. ACRSL]MCG7345655.1 putative thiazole-containing bacteriocin maturation protein [Sporosarcina sp. ACRSL]